VRTLSDDSRDKRNQNKKKEKEKRGRRWVITVILVTFVISSLLQMVQAGLMSKVNLAMAFVILITFILIGILFDIIGVAVTSANETPFHSLSSQKIRGAKEAVRLVRNADRVGSFCNDVIGDIVGIISGSATTAIVVMIISSGINIGNLALTVIMTALVAALTIGGKAAGKRIAIEKANNIVFFVGKVISFIAPAK
jgi:Mg2+/Co2+ transporter CorB